MKSSRMLSYALGPVILLLLAENAGGQSFSPSARYHQAHSCCPNLPRIQLHGWRGQPYREPQTGGCQCSRCSRSTCYNVSAHWTSPASVFLDFGSRGDHVRSTADTTQPRPRDMLDGLSNLKLIPYKRRDNGHTGCDCDPYGRLSDSRRGVLPDTSNPVYESTAHRSRPLNNQ